MTSKLFFDYHFLVYLTNIVFNFVSDRSLLNYYLLAFDNEQIVLLSSFPCIVFKYFPIFAIKTLISMSLNIHR